MRKTICVLLTAGLLLFSLTACSKKSAEADSSDYSDYIISSGTYANGDAPFEDIPFIQYSISVPSDWAAEESGYWENEAYYTFHKDGSTDLYAGESYVMEYMDEAFRLAEIEVATLEFGDYEAKLRVVNYDDGYRYFFYIPVGGSYCEITGRAPERTQEQQDEFFEIVKTFKTVE